MATLRKKKLGVVLVRNFLVQLTETQLELGKRAKREFIGSQNPRTTRLREGMELLGFRDKWGKGHKNPGGSLF